MIVTTPIVLNVRSILSYRNTILIEITVISIIVLDAVYMKVMQQLGKFFFVYRYEITISNCYFMEPRTMPDRID